MRKEIVETAKHFDYCEIAIRMAARWIIAYSILHEFAHMLGNEDENRCNQFIISNYARVTNYWMQRRSFEKIKLETVSLNIRKDGRPISYFLKTLGNLLQIPPSL